MNSGSKSCFSNRNKLSLCCLSKLGDVNTNDYEYIVSHPSLVPDLAAIRGIIKRKFPMVKNRTVSSDLVAEIQRLKSGIKIKLEKNDQEPDFGFFETPIGTVRDFYNNI